MAIRQIITGAHPSCVAGRKLKNVNPAVLKLLQDMAETMYARGVGLAPQIGISRKLVVIDRGEPPAAADQSYFLEKKER